MAWTRKYEPVATEYTVASVPEDDPRYWSASVQVRRINPGVDQWSVKRCGEHVALDGTARFWSDDIVWDEEWRRTHWFPLEQALTIADLACELDEAEV